MFKDKYVLVTGGCGFIGSNMARRLVYLGANVTVVDNLVAGNTENIEDIKDRINFRIADLRSEAEAIRVCTGKDYVFHMAADMGGMGYISDNKKVMYNNLLIDMNMLKAAEECGVARLLYTSSACVYPLYRQSTPAVEPLKESDVFPAQPDTPYGWEKLTAEMLFENELGSRVRIARLHNVYGPYSSFDERGKAPMHLIMKAIKHPDPPFEIWGDGEQTRSFLFIDDCIDALIRLMELEYCHPVNIGSDRLISINELADLVIKISGKDIIPKWNPDMPQGVRGRNADISLAREVLGWEPKVSLEEGLKLTYDWVVSRWKR